MLPENFTERMRIILGEEFGAFLQSLEGPACRSLRVNPLKSGWEEFVKKPPFLLTPVPWEERGYYYEREARPGKHPFHDAGVYYIQEASAMAPAVLLGARPGERVLDLCAAPGGKSTQIAADMRGEGLLVSNEIHPARAKILSENIERLGVVNALVLNEAPEKLAGIFPEYFDRILVDAPCSGEGMFGRKEEALRQWSVSNVELCAARQDGILDQAAVMLRPGGRLVYSTCTFAPEEDEGSVGRFLKRHPEFCLLEPERFAGMERGLTDYGAQMEKTVRLWPHRLKGDGHFAAVLQKEGSAEDGHAGRARKTGQTQKGLSDKEGREYRKLLAEAAVLDRPGIFLRYADRLYLAPEGLPALNGLRALRPGLHVGTLKKNRLEPAHALALALRPGQASGRLSLPAQSEEMAAYLHGQAFRTEGEKGWKLILADGYGIGWGKLAGGMVKNHYPKGLRKNY